ncbi:MAG: PDZ domain-containing protein [Bdellovibrionales bacterium]
MKTDTGALVTQVYENSPTEKSGIKPYDVFLEFNDKKIESAADLARTVQDTTAGKTYSAKIERNGKTISKRIKVEENPDQIVASGPRQRSLKGLEAKYDLGFKVIDYSPQIARDWGLPKVKGSPPIIIDVDQGTPASIAGLVAGDLILDVNRKSVRTAADVNRHLNKNAVNLMRILRNGNVALVQLRPAK